MRVACHEHHVLDVVVVDELEERGALGRIAFVAVAGVDDRTEVLDRLRQHHEFPGHALVAGVEQVLLQPFELDLAQHGAARLEGGGQEREHSAGSSGLTGDGTSASRNERASSMMIDASEP